MSTARSFSLVAILLGAAIAAAQSQSLSYIGGLQYASGDFVFGQRTWSAYLSNGLAWSAGPIRASASVPLVMQPSGWLQYSGTGMMVPSGGMSSGQSSTSGMGATGRMNGGSMMASSDMPFSQVGIGDPIGRIDVALLASDAGHPWLSLVGAVKAPLADVQRGFGTGEWDVGAGLSGAASISGTSVFADAVYWNVGNPAGASLRNAVAYALSIGRAMPRSRWSVLGTVSGASSLWAGLQAPVQAGIGVGYLLESGNSVFMTGAAGLTHTAPAISTGLGWRVPLGKAR